MPRQLAPSPFGRLESDLLTVHGFRADTLLHVNKIVSPASTIVILMVSRRETLALSGVLMESKPPILANRFLLNLHAASTASISNGSAADWRGVMSSPLGDIGTVEFRRSCGDIQETDPIELM